MEDIFGELIQYFYLLYLLKSRIVSCSINKKSITILQTKLSGWTGLILDDYTIDELIHLSKRYITKSGIYCSYIISDAATSSTTTAQICTMGDYNIFQPGKIIPTPVSGLEDVIEIAFDDQYHSQHLLIKTIAGDVYYIEDTMNIFCLPSKLNKVRRIAIKDDNILILRINGDLYRVWIKNGIEETELIYQGIVFISFVTRDYAYLIGQTKTCYVYNFERNENASPQLECGRTSGIISLKLGRDCYIFLTEQGDLTMDYKDEMIISKNIIDFVNLENYLLILSKNGKLSVMAPDFQIFFIMNDIMSITGADDHALTLTSDEKIYGFGQNQYGQLGLGDKNDRTAPTLIIDLKKYNYILENI